MTSSRTQRDQTQTVAGVDACPVGWIATVITPDGTEIDVFEEFEALVETYSGADRILVDIPIGLKAESRRRCDVEAKELLGSRGLSVFYAPCESAVDGKHESYQEAKTVHKDHVGNGLSQQAHSIAPKIQAVRAVVDDCTGPIREGHPELCFAALNGQPVAYSKTTERGREFRMKLLADELPEACELYNDVRGRFLLREVRRDDILDSMALAVAAGGDDLRTVPSEPHSGEPRIYYPAYSPATLAFE